MKTQMKSDALLDAFEKFELTDAELLELEGGDSVSWKLPNGTAIIIATMDSNGSISYMNILGQPMTAQQIMDMNDHFFTP